MTTPRFLGRLTRVITPGRRFIPEIDGLRFVAIATVVLYHISQWILIRHAQSTPAPRPLDVLNRVGYYGVELFFVISGFVLSVPFARHALAGAPKVNLRAYFMRRVARLEPPYLLVLLGVFVAYSISTGSFATWKHALASAVYQHNMIYGEANPFLGPAWSLEIEIQFYVLTPLMARVFTIRSPWARRALLVAVMATLAHLTGSPRVERWHLSLGGHLHEFLAGYLLADIYVADWKEAPAPSLRWDAVSAASWVMLFGALAYRSPRVNALLPFLVLAAYCAAFRGRFSRQLFRWPWLTTIGGMCYTIYLLHIPIIRPLSAVLARANPPLPYARAYLLHASLLVPTVLAASLLFFMLVERPCMNPRWPIELWSRVQGWAARAAGRPAAVTVTGSRTRSPS